MSIKKIGMVGFEYSRFEDAMAEVRLKDHHAMPNGVALIDESIININGVKWRKNDPELQRKSSGRFSKLMAMTALMYGSMLMPSSGSRGKKRPSVDLVKEFELVQLKQSKLSRSDRDWVERMFKSNYTQVND